MIYNTGKAKVVVVRGLGGKFSCCFPSFTRKDSFDGIVYIILNDEQKNERATSKFPLPKCTFLFRVFF